MFTLYCHSVLSEISFHGRVQFDNLQFDVCPNNENKAFAGQFLNYFLSKKYEGVIIKGQDRSACSEENVLFKFYFPGHSCIESVPSKKFKILNFESEW